jgi:hypothetical protein
MFASPVKQQTGGRVCFPAVFRPIFISEGVFAMSMNPAFCVGPNVNSCVIAGPLFPTLPAPKGRRPSTGIFESPKDLDPATFTAAQWRALADAWKRGEGLLRKDRVRQLMAAGPLV